MPYTHQTVLPFNDAATNDDFNSDGSCPRLDREPDLVFNKNPWLSKRKLKKHR